MYSLIGRYCLLYPLPKYAVCFVLPLLLLAGCRKRDEDRLAPSIQLESPYVGATFYYLNSISVEATVQDDRQLEYVTLEITNAQNIRYLETKNYYPTGNTLDINYTIAHNDLFLSSGTYYVKITASDGVNQQIAFREIQLIEAPRLLERIFVVRDVGGTTAIDSLSGNNLLPGFTYAHTYNFGGIDSRTQQLVLCGANPATLASYSYPDLQAINAAFPLTDDVISAFYHDKQQHSFFWGTEQGHIWKTTTSGTQLVTSTGPSRVMHIGMHSGHLIVATQGVTNNFIHVIRADNGVIETTLPFSWELKGTVELASDNNRVLIIGNQNNAAHFVWLNLATAAFNEVFNFYETSLVRSLCNGSGNDFYVVHDNGLAHYSNGLNSYTLNADLTPTRLIYDDLQHVLCGVLTDELLFLNETGLNTLQSIAAPGIQDVWLKYNK